MIDVRRQLIGGRPPNVDAALRSLVAAGVRLPDEVSNANRALMAIAEAARKRQVSPPAPTPEEDAERIVAAATAGEPLPDNLAAGGVQAYLAREAMAHAKRAWAVALDRATANRNMAFNRAGLGLYGALRDGLEAVLDEAHQVVAGLGGLNPSDRATMARDERALAAYPRLAALAEQYALIRAAQVALRPFLGNPKVDINEWYAEVQNAQALMGEQWANRANLDATLGPSDSIERLRWLVSGQAQPWLPTPDEQDQALTDESARLHAEREADFRGRQAEAAGRGESLVREGPTAGQWRAAERAARQRADAQRSR